MKRAKSDYDLFFISNITQGAVARVGSKVVCNYSLQVDPRSTPTSSTFFREDLVMKIFLQPFFLFC